MSCVMGKHVFGVFDKVRYEQGCANLEDDQRLEILDLGSRQRCSIYVAKTKALISSAVTIVRETSSYS